MESKKKMSQIKFRKNFCLNCGHVFYNALGKRRTPKIATYLQCNVRSFKDKNCSSKCSVNWWHKNPIYKRLVSKVIKEYIENENKKRILWSVSYGYENWKE
jgi:hypothetical protein